MKPKIHVTYKFRSECQKNQVDVTSSCFWKVGQETTKFYNQTCRITSNAYICTLCIYSFNKNKINSKLEEKRKKDEH